MPYIARPLTERFWAKVRFTETCWEWTAAHLQQGYGLIGVWRNGTLKMERTHRLIYELCFGPIPGGLCVLHECDNPRCVRPDHLHLGTNQTNIAERVARGRSAFGERNGRTTHPEMRPRGERNNHAKLTAPKVLEIRSLRASTSVRQLAAMYEVSIDTIYNITQRETWRHI